MNSVILTGCCWSNSEHLLEGLTSVGFKSAIAAHGNGDQHSIKDWHDQVFTLQPSEPKQQLQLGKSWEQLAGEIFRANWQQQTWGWADCRSTWLLEFWRDFDPNVRFVLIHTQPQQAIARAMAEFEQSTAFSIDSALTHWLAYERELLRFYLRNLERCVLVDSQLASSQPLELVKLLNSQWQLRLNEPGKLLGESKNTPAQAMAELLAQEAIRGYPEVQSLCQEIESCLSNPQWAASTPNTEGLSGLTNAINGFRSLAYDQAVTLPALAAARQENAEFIGELSRQIEDLSRQLKRQQAEKTQVRQENDLLLQQLHQAQEKLEQYVLKTQALETQHRQQAELSEQQHGEIDRLRHEQQLKDHELSLQQQENETVLLQLHQVQEELEQYFLRAQALENEHRQQAELAEQRHGEIDRLRHEQQSKDHALARQQQENETLLSRLQQAQGELEQSLLKIQALEKQLSNNAEVIEHKQAEVQRLQNHQQSVQQENDLLLLQLHQVQEELEQYFLRYQQQQTQCKQTEERLNRCYQRLPGFVEIESLMVGAGDSKKAPEIKLVAKNIYHPSREVDEFTFKVRVDKKSPAIVIERNENASPLLRWPTELATETTLIIPLVTTTNEPGSGLLSTSDWHLMKALTQTCAQALQNDEYRLLPNAKEFNATGWPAVLSQFHQSLSADSNCLRYDRISLKRTNAMTGYESLWLQCDNLSLNGKQWPQAEFRLSAADIKPGKFSIHPRLEFPHTQPENTLLEAWRPEIADESGDRMEFRFETQAKLFDLEFWNGLSQNDKALTLALIWHLPILLADLEAQHAGINRPWQDWQNLANEMMAVIKLRMFGVATENH